MKNNLKSIGKVEYSDGINWFTLASEDWVKNNSTGYICLAATTINLLGNYNNTTNTITNFDSIKTELVIDNVILNVGDYILVKNQSISNQNGIYKVIDKGSSLTDWVITRIDAFSTSANMVRGNVVNVIKGAVNAVTSWMLTSLVTNVGVDDVVFSEFSNNNFNLLGTNNQIKVSVINGVATVSIAEDSILPGNAGVVVPKGSTAQRSISPIAGTIRFNTSL